VTRARTTRRLPNVAVFVVIAVMSSGVGGCSVHGLSFVQDDRVVITEPAGGATISLPFDLEWSSEGFDGSYAVFFDRPPMRPDRTLLSLVPTQDACRTDPACPTVEWLSIRQVYVTHQTALHVEQLPELRASNRAADRHEVTIVLLDEEGRRMGEAAFTRDFIVDRED
jgi:hypothetical protein